MANSAVVVYSSKYGYTEKYARWISEILGCPAFNMKNVKIGDLDKYSTVIYGGSLYAGNIKGTGFIKKNWNELDNKNLIIFTVSLADPEAKEYFSEIENKAFDNLQGKKIKFFNFHGGIDYDKLGFLHKILMKMLKSMVSKKNENERSEMEQQIVESYGKTVDFTDKNSIMPLIEYVQGIK